MNEQQDLVLSTLEPDQLADAKRRHVPRRHLKRPEILLLWCLRIYLLFMVAVVVYQSWTGAR
jgi:hypothetical protein